MLKVSAETIMQVITEGIYYFNMLGEIKSASNLFVSEDTIKGNKCGKEIYFKWEDLNKKFYLTKEQAEEEAKKYLDSVLKYVDLKTLKKIVKIKSNDKFYYVENNHIYTSTLESYSHWNKYRKMFIEIIEYDDDYGGGYHENEYPISEYGKTWALTRKELNVNEKDN